MTEAALPESPRDLSQCLYGLLEILRRLSVELGVTVKHQALPGDATGTYNAATNTVIIKPDAPIEDQFALLLEIGQLLTIGPEAVRWGQQTPTLRLVASPETDIDIG